MYQPGSAVAVEFVVNSFTTGAAVNADSLPTAVLVRNGTDQGTTVTVANVDTGRYKVTCTIPAWTFGDSIAISVSATIGGTACKSIVLTDVLQPLASDIISALLTTAVPTSNTAQTVGDALNAARAQGFGKWVFSSGTTLTLYAADGTTVVRTFTVDSATAPTQRV